MAESGQLQRRVRCKGGGEGWGRRTAGLSILLPLFALFCLLLLLDASLLHLGPCERLLLGLALLLEAGLEPLALLASGVALELLEEGGDALGLEDLGLVVVGPDRLDVGQRQPRRKELEEVRGELGSHPGRQVVVGVESEVERATGTSAAGRAAAAEKLGGRSSRTKTRPLVHLSPGHPRCTGQWPLHLSWRGHKWMEVWDTGIEGKMQRPALHLRNRGYRGCDASAAGRAGSGGRGGAS